jgi:hypothetical protein
MTTTATVDTKAKNLETMRAVTQMLKDEQRAPRRMTKEVPAVKLLKEVGIKSTSKKETKHEASRRLVPIVKGNVEMFVTKLMEQFPGTSDVNARIYYGQAKSYLAKNSQG